MNCISLSAADTCRGPLVGLYIYSDTANDAYVRQLAMNAMVIVGIMQPFQTSEKKSFTFFSSWWGTAF